jgi:RNA polymerase sigma-70 factor (ECF subfamily)
MAIPIPGKAGFAEDQLLSQAREGSAEAFCVLIDPLQTRLLRQAVGLGHDLTAAEDLVQQTLVEAWRSLKRFDGTCRFSTWLYAILLHRHQKVLRAAAVRPLPISRLPAEQARGGHDALERVIATDMPPDMAARHADQVRRIRQFVQCLSPVQRDVVLLRFFEGAPLAEIASVMGSSIGTVKSRLHHALENLRRMNLTEFRGDTRV